MDNFPQGYSHLGLDELEREEAEEKADEDDDSDLTNENERKNYKNREEIQGQENR